MAALVADNLGDRGVKRIVSREHAERQWRSVAAKRRSGGAARSSSAGRLALDHGTCYRYEFALLKGSFTKSLLTFHGYQECFTGL